MRIRGCAASITHQVLLVLLVRNVLSGHTDALGDDVKGGAYVGAKQKYR